MLTMLNLPVRWCCFIVDPHLMSSFHPDRCSSISPFLFPPLHTHTHNLYNIILIITSPFPYILTQPHTILCLMVPFQTVLSGNYYNC